MRASLIRGFTALVGVLAAAWLTGCVSLPPPEPRAPVTAFTDVGQTELGQLAAKGVPGDSTALSGFRLLPEAAFAFDARISLARHAEKSLDVQYYLIQKDDVGLLFLKELREAAARGVRVRLLVDDLYTAGEDEVFSSFSAFPNVEVRLFNPLPSRADSLATRLLFSLTDFGRINHRMHNKMLIADNSFAVSGGRNIGNEYFMRSTAANFIDMDVISSGAVVRQMSEGFDRYWNSSHAWPIERIAPLRTTPEAAQQRFDAIVRTAVPDVPIRPRDVLNKSPVGEQLITGKIDRYWALGTLFVDDPEKITRKADDAYAGSVTEGALSVINSARREVKIGSPYFIPGTRGMEMMKKAIESGGRITVITNSLGATDEPLAYAGYERYRADMLKIGVTIYEIAPMLTARSGQFGDFGKTISRLHAKLAVIDDERFFVGSMNLDHRSAAVNTEVGLVIDSPELVADYNKLMNSQRINLGYRLRLAPNGRRVQWLEYDDAGGDIVHEDEPGEFLWLRFKNWLLLPIVGEELL
ncbi:putative cardiolipin synthase [Variovorax boronicumulans]|uniref:Cardiolipin synthase n=1 Tax=Variovorax boronicumulans TaxID=436515 RepID=A0AAW8DAX1_9BURK|nr:MULTISPECIES: phospholipase D family protein [Variovorax]MDP9897258.1 putative cardiolipin synthase [Variovorax boronicumulans]MDQ0038815.1 putative cardiolipin synthase [Variovorax boronicumulans]MDQ0045193.1 putative cardiolipin synthase [Variovorax boronicumulans]MDQ0057299.1 putative cardiolipin synthase [Variovorax boronicumulans]MDQ0074205.1 putative cardiolipin synthase [Variovorax boronicumulans]